MKRAIFKVPNGKLLKILLEDEGGTVGGALSGAPKITSLKITGDFFMYPEEHVEALEAALAGCEIEAGALRSRVEEFLKKTPTQFFGLDTESLVSTILQASVSS